MGQPAEMPVLSTQPSPALLAFVQRQVLEAQLYAGPERRSEPRQLLVKPVLVYPADENFSPTGPSCVMVIRDISSRGMELVHEEPINWPLVLVRISLPEIEALVGAVVRWRRPVGPFYFLGCEVHSHFDNI
jgi:hypothetical protein